jgi:hypothetical protein
VWNERRIQVRYRRWAVPTDVTRTLNPYGLVIKAGRFESALDGFFGPSAPFLGAGVPCLVKR